MTTTQQHLFKTFTILLCFVSPEILQEKSYDFHLLAHCQHDNYPGTGTILLRKAMTHYPSWILDKKNRTEISSTWQNRMGLLREIQP